MAARDAFLTLDRGRRINRWSQCGTCHQALTGALCIEMDRRVWRHHREATPDVSDYDVRQVLGNVAGSLRHSDEIDAADQLTELVVRGLGRDDPMVLRAELERALVETDHDAALESLTRLRPRVAQCESLAVREDFAGKMTCVLANLERHREAIPYAVESIELATAYEGAESETALVNMYTLGRLLVDAGRVDEGMAALSRVHATQTRVLGADHHETRETRDMLDALSAAMRA
mmetsp:Transcript_8432/g.34726  ORF Transcript_8432/g.34726 Transcript_8432/m.34726 type:complete len:233 (-) Transcript_8432:313-1011(-)